MKVIYCTFIVFTVISLACGVQAQLPTSEPDTLVKSVKLQEPTVTETHIEVPTGCGVKINFDVPIKVHTLGKLNVRECPSTSSPVLSVLPEGAEIEVGAVVEIADTGYNCNRWRPLVWNGRAAWVCSEWTSK